MPATTLLGRWLRHARWGNPAAVQHAVEFSHLAARVKPPAASASASELGIIQWHRWPLSTGGDIAYWQPGPRGLQCQRLPYSPAAGLTTTTYDDNFSCSIRDIISLASGKGDLVDYATLDSYAFGECRGLVHSDRASIEPLLSWHELRFHGGAGESLEGFSWQPGGYHLHNQGGAHHFAAARLIAGFFDPELHIKAPLTRHALNPEVALSILAAFDIFCEPEDHTMNEAFMRRMEAAQIPFATCAAPPPWHCGHRLLLFPREHTKATATADIFRAYGWLDVGALLGRHAMLQQ